MVGDETVAREFQWVRENPEAYHLMQFTGLLDKNGTEIYEGDILNQEDGWYRVIEWDEGAAGFIGVAIEKDVYEKYWNNLGEMDLSAEVIGNIYENPELSPSLPEDNN